MPPPPNPTEQEAQTAQMQKTMVWLSPLMIGYFALTVPAGLGLYWFVGNCVSIIQQSFVVGWGNVLPARFRRPAARGSRSRDSLLPKKGPSKSPGAGLKSQPQNGTKQKKPKRNRPIEPTDK
jgi:membrane protein insertase Oxa1/YidC/SpoIIIJ